MHSKMKGNLGEAAIVKDLIKNGFAVFKELGDLSKTDLIAEKNNKLIRFQIKAATSKNGKITFDTRKAGPNYSFRYELDQVDAFAFYCLDTDQVGYITTNKFLESKSTKVFRLTPPKNTNQWRSKTIYFKDLTLSGLLRDLTQDTLTDNAEGDDKVQTTTVRAEEISE